MTKQEYENAKLDIINKFGPPRHDKGKPMNESASKMSALRALQAREGRFKKAEDSLIEKNAKLQEESDKITSNKPDQFHIPAGSLAEFAKFPEEEQRMLSSYFHTTTDNVKAQAIRAGVSYQKAISFYSSDRFLLFRHNAFNELKNDMLPQAVKALKRCLKSPNENVVLRAAELLGLDLGLLNGQKKAGDAGTPAITDPKALEALRELGHKLAIEKP
jgi:hypothetical protein